MEQNSHKDEKKDLRRRIRAALSALSPAARYASDQALFAGFLDLPQVAAARTILLFYGVGIEPDTKQLIAPLLAAGKRVALPRVLPERRLEARLVASPGGEALITGVLDIPEPSEDCPLLLPGEIDLILVPALCCDRAGYRLGQGGGYYDRYLSAYQGATVALCRDIVLQERLPREAHDWPVQYLITESGGLVPR